MKTRPHLPPLDPQQRYSVEEAILYLRSSRKTFFDDVRLGRIGTIKEGKRRFIPGTELVRRSRLPTDGLVAATVVPSSGEEMRR
jgi:hypothetical protein